MVRFLRDGSGSLKNSDTGVTLPLDVGTYAWTLNFYKDILRVYKFLTILYWIATYETHDFW